MKTFKDIIQSFENNDIQSFETLVRKERALYHPNETLESSLRSPSQLQSLQPISLSSQNQKSPPSMPRFNMTNLQSMPASPIRDYNNGNILGSTRVTSNPKSAIFGVNSQRRFIEEQIVNSDLPPESSRQITNHRQQFYGGSSVGFKGGKSQRFSSIQRPLIAAPSPYTKELFPSLKASGSSKKVI